jgi:hypothetical protein
MSGKGTTHLVCPFLSLESLDVCAKMMLLWTLSWFMQEIETAFIRKMKTQRCKDVSWCGQTYA